MSLAHEKNVTVLCGISKVSEEGLRGKYTDEQLKKITVFDLASRYGSEASMKDTQNCLRKLCEGELLQQFQTQ